MVRIRTPSRLHFGLFALPNDGAGPWLSQDGRATLPRRHFGGVGLMIDQPGIDVSVARGPAWAAEGALAERGLRCAQAYCASAGISTPFRIHVHSAAAEHTGLGTGTQFGLAVATGKSELTGQPQQDGITLAQHVGRGLRSALGAHGFDRGGFLVEGGKTCTEKGIVAPLLVHQDFPEEWAVLLVQPTNVTGTHGIREIEAFAHLAAQDQNDRRTEALCRLVLLGMLPALVERDLPAFGEAIYDFNRRVGEMFQPAQNGIYAHPRIEEIVRHLREAGIRGVGQSSWGPTVFAIVPTEQAAEIRQRVVRNEPGSTNVLVAQASPRGAEVLSQAPG